MIVDVDDSPSQTKQPKTTSSNELQLQVTPISEEINIPTTTLPKAKRVRFDADIVPDEQPTPLPVEQQTLVAINNEIPQYYTGPSLPESLRTC